MQATYDKSVTWNVPRLGDKTSGCQPDHVRQILCALYFCRKIKRSIFSRILILTSALAWGWVGLKISIPSSSPVSESHTEILNFHPRWRLPSNIPYFFVFFVEYWHTFTSFASDGLWRDFWSYFRTNYNLPQISHQNQPHIFTTDIDFIFTSSHRWQIRSDNPEAFTAEAIKRTPGPCPPVVSLHIKLRFLYVISKLTCPLLLVMCAKWVVATREWQ